MTPQHLSQPRRQTSMHRQTTQQQWLHNHNPKVPTPSQRPNKLWDDDDGPYYSRPSPPATKSRYLQLKHSHTKWALRTLRLCLAAPHHRPTALRKSYHSPDTPTATPMPAAIISQSQCGVKWIVLWGIGLIYFQNQAKIGHWTIYVGCGTYFYMAPYSDNCATSRTSSYVQI